MDLDYANAEKALLKVDDFECRKCQYDNMTETKKKIDQILKYLSLDIIFI